MNLRFLNFHFFYISCTIIIYAKREDKTMHNQLTKKDIEDAKEMLEDKELRELAELEMLEAKERLPKIEEELKILLIPKDPNDDSNVIREIRA